MGMSPGPPNCAIAVACPLANHSPVLGRYTPTSERPVPSKSATTGTSPGPPKPNVANPRDDCCTNHVAVLGRYRIRSVRPSPSRSPWNGTSSVPDPNPGAPGGTIPPETNQSASPGLTRRKTDRSDVPSPL